MRGSSSLSGARRSSAFRLARSTLDGLETQLALEEAELGRVRAELERARVRLLETVERCRQGDETSRARREEALNFAKEVRESAAREAEEVLAPVTAERLRRTARPLPQIALPRRRPLRLARQRSSRTPNLFGGPSTSIASASRPASRLWTLARRRYAPGGAGGAGGPGLEPQS